MPLDTSARPARALLASGALIAALGAGPATATVVLPPLFAGSFAVGSGADAGFYQVANNWHESTVLWDETLHQFGVGQPIGSYAWGEGLWGLADWRTISAAAGAGCPGSAPIVQCWQGRAPTINYANAMYNTLFSSTWGTANLVPFFGADGSPDSQQNWISSFSGYISITDPGRYNFGVLNDDGFFLRLIGGGGLEQDLTRDYLNPRDRNGFADDLELGLGLYRFELGAWNRLEAGVVDLRWTRDGSSWDLVPTSHLLSANAVPEPSLPALLGAAALAWLGLQARRGLALSTRKRGRPHR